MKNLIMTEDCKDFIFYNKPRWKLIKTFTLKFKYSFKL